MKMKNLLLTVVAACVTVASSYAQLTAFQVGGIGTVNGANNWPTNEPPVNAIDGVTTNKYLNFGEFNTGYIFTLATGTAVANGISLTTANDGEARDPASFSLYGSNTAVANSTQGTIYDLSEFTPIVQNLALTLPSARNTTAPLVTFTNTDAYSTYLVIFPTVKDSAAANSMQIAEARLQTSGTPVSNVGTVAGGQLVPEPSSLALVGLATTGLLLWRRRR